MCDLIEEVKETFLYFFKRIYLNKLEKADVVRKGIVRLVKQNSRKL